MRNEDDVVVNRALPAIATGVDPAEEEERHLQQALLASVYGDTTAAAADIPIPVVSRVQPPKMPTKDPFKRPPNQYIVFDRSDEDLEHACIDYDADFEDDAFLAKFNAAHPTSEKTKSAALTIHQLESALDALEKVQGRSGNEDTIISYSAARSALADALPNFMDTARREVYQHWFLRREAHPTPFLRFYQKQPNPSDQNPAVAFRPRDKDATAAAGRRMNTYENFRRGTTLREELESLRNILKTVILRESIKTELLSVQILHSRIAMLSEGGPRLEFASRSTLNMSRDAVITYGEAPAQKAIPCRGLTLPANITITELAGDMLLADRAKKRKKNASRGGTENSRTGAELGDSASRSLDRNRDARAGVGTQPGVDTFGFDEHGNRFLKHMRYFAGGFMNYGVCPYDHRVFAAASERNTVRELPCEPQSVLFPSDAVRFGTIPTENVRDSTTSAAGPPRRPRGGKTSYQMKKSTGTVLNDNMFKAQKNEYTTARRRPIRVRGRVARGGRIVLDRVMYEPERGVKAASYPSSVEMGGVYTAGIPLEAAQRVLASTRYGNLGDVSLLQPSPLCEGNDDASKASGTENGELYWKLVRPLKPMTNPSKGVVTPSGETDYWPHRKTRTRHLRSSPRAIQQTSVADDASSAPPADDALQSWNASLRTLPAFAPMTDDLIVEVEPRVPVHS